MRTGGTRRLGRRRVVRLRVAALLAGLLLQGAGCAAASQSWRAGPAGIPAERGLRAQLSQGQFVAAFEALKSKDIAPADALLRHMYRGVVALHAGELESGAKSMDRAWEISHDRWTKRMSDGAMALLTSDAALPYYPGPAERMFIPYYGGLAWLARSEPASAAVEARRLSQLLESEAGPQPSDDFRGVMRYVAGVLYEVAGERNDADVSFRNAAALLATMPGDTLPPDEMHGDVVILVEDGFVGRPEPAGMTFWYKDDEIDLLNGDDDAVRFTTVSELRRRRQLRQDWSGFHSVTLTWPEFTSSAAETTEDMSARGLGARAPTAPEVAAPMVVADVTAAVRADFERQQPIRLARAIARAVLRDAALDAAGKSFEKATDDDDDDDKKKKDGKASAIGHVLLGIGLLATSATSAVLDQPDLRAWQLLPDRVAVTRLRLPVGEHEIEVVRGADVVSIGRVTVRAGGVTLLTHRWWTGGMGGRTLVERGGEIPDYLTRGSDVMDPRDRPARLPVLLPSIVAHQ